jgi:acyl carrier protein
MFILGTIQKKKSAQLWADVLTLDRVEIHDNFFDLGGHSLAAMRIVNRLGDIFSAEISLTDLFDSPTVAELATIVSHKFEAGELDSILAEIESLTDEAAQRLLSDRLEKSRG